MRAWWRGVRPRILAAIIYCLARLIGFTLRVRVLGMENIDRCEGGRIIAGWHGRTFLAALMFRDKGWWALISHSRDGEMQNGIFKRFGFKTIRGSTGRGGARAAAECARILRRGETFVFTPDGPRGPSQKVQKGILWLAQKGNAAIIPAAASARPRKLFSSWDRYMIPLPFAKGVILVGEPMRIPENANQNTLDEYGAQLENQLNELQAKAERELGFA